MEKHLLFNKEFAAEIVLFAVKYGDWERGDSEYFDIFRG